MAVGKKIIMEVRAGINQVTVYDIHDKGKNMEGKKKFLFWTLSRPLLPSA